MPISDVSPIPDPVLHDFRAEVEALPARKRAKWRGLVRDTSGVAHRVHFINGEFGFKYQSTWTKLVALTDLRLANILEADPVAKTNIIRTLLAQESGGFEAAEEELGRIIDETATGNHHSKPHKIKIPTGPGEPVRG